MRMRLGQRGTAIIFGVAAGLALVILIALGSRVFHWFDSALIGYAVASVFALAAVTYKYTFWLMRPQTGRYFWRSWQLFLSLENFRRYTTLIPRDSRSLHPAIHPQARLVSLDYTPVHLLGRGHLMSDHLPAHLWLAAVHPDA
jgi:hypothetical protein